MIISRQIEWDMGHRIPHHGSVCRNLHGHRYKAEILVKGKLIDRSGVADEGMVMDFGEIKKIAIRHIHNVLDHGFMVWEKDRPLVNFFKKNDSLKHIVVGFVPTAENIAAWIFLILDKHFKDKFKTGLKLDSVKVWETPTTIAVCSRRDINDR